MLTEKSEKKNTRKCMWQAQSLQPCDRHRSLLISMFKISPPHRYYRYIKKLLKRLWTRETTG